MSPLDQEGRRRGLDERMKADRAREALWEDLGQGCRLGPDRPPGVGWRLEVPGRPPRFYATRALAWAVWVQEREHPT